MKFNIFGKTIAFFFNNKILKEELSSYLSIYPESKCLKTDVNIYFIDDISKINQNISNNPSIHTYCKNGFKSEFGNWKIAYIIEDHLNIYFEVPHSSKFLSAFSRFIDIGFRSKKDKVKAFLCELILVPTVYFFNDRVIIHASAVNNIKTNKTILFGGTGGVGKTSLELLLCNKLRYSFVADDIVIFDHEGFAYPNLAYPKIYAYNVEGNPKLKRKILSNSYLDSFQWSLAKRIKGLKGVRRAISPIDLYHAHEKDKKKVSEYYILARTKLVKKIEIKPITAICAAKLSKLIIENEYNEFTKHVIWQEYNACLHDAPSFLNLEKIYTQWLKIYENIFNNISCYIIQIPINLPHKDFIMFFENKFKYDK